MMKHFPVLVFALCAQSLFCQFDAAKAGALLKSVDSLLSFQSNDLSAELRVEQSSPGGATSTTLAALFRRDRKNQYLILVLEPEIDKGKGYLKTGDNLWLYDPVGRRFTFTSAKERFQNSSARNSDFTKSNLSLDYAPVDATKQKLGAYDCDVLTLKATNDRVAYPRMKVWISDDGLLRKYEDYSLSGSLMRTTGIVDYRKIGNNFVPVKMVILDHLKSKKIGGKIQYDRTNVTISNASLKPVDNILFTKEYLEKVNK